MNKNIRNKCHKSINNRETKSQSPENCASQNTSNKKK